MFIYLTFLHNSKLYSPITMFTSVFMDQIEDFLGWKMEAKVIVYNIIIIYLITAVPTTWYELYSSKSKEALTLVPNS